LISVFKQTKFELLIYLKFNTKAMKKIVFWIFSLLVLGEYSASGQDARSTIEKKADDFISRYGYDEDYSRFYIRTSFSFDYGLCNYDPCDYYDEDQGVGYDYLTTVHFDPGTGLDYDLYGGYHVNRFISVGLGLDYLHGLNVKQTRTGTGEGGSFSETLKLHSSVFSIRPTLELSPGFDRINPFIDFGAVIGIVPRVMDKETSTTSIGTATTEIIQTGVYHGGVPIGFDIKAGVDYKLSKSFNLYADLSFIGMNYTPTKYSMKSYTVNGIDELSSLTTKQKETVFVKSYDRSENIPSDSPNKQLKETIPFTGIGLDIGVKIILGDWRKF
jgi:hypothetical protein